MGERLHDFHDLKVFQNAMGLAMEIFEISKTFPREEQYSLIDQIRRSSRSVCANLAEAWAKRRYDKAFVAKLSDSEAEACETQVWIKFALKCQYIDHHSANRLNQNYKIIIAQIVTMINSSSKWLL